MKDLWQRIRVAGLSVPISAIGLALSLAGCLSRDWGVPPAYAYACAAAGSVGIVLGVLGLLKPAPDEKTPWRWEFELLKDLFSGRPFVLCRRHVTAGAQGLAIGCYVAQEVSQAVGDLEKVLGAHLAELELEVDAGMLELAEHGRLLDVVQKTVSTVRSIKSVQQLEVLAGYADSCPVLAGAARNILNELERVELLIKRYGVDTLDDAYKAIRRSQGQSAVSVNSVDFVRSTIRTAKQSISDSMAILKQVSAQARMLTRETNGLWARNSHTVQGNVFCKPRDPVGPVPAAQ